MFDGSGIPLADNLRISAELLGETRRIGVLLELEIGIVGGEEDDIDHLHVDREWLYSTPEDAVAVAAALGTGEHGRYLLSATFGNVHGHPAPRNVELRPELLGELQAAVRRRFPGATGFDFVFHGSSGSTADALYTAIRHGVVKVNVDTDMQVAFTRAVAEHVLAHAGSFEDRADRAVDKAVHDPRTWGRSAESAMADRVVDACRSLGSSGRSLVAG
jgi:fructose-bisphosphate aldolase class II